MSNSIILTVIIRQFVGNDKKGNNKMVRAKVVTQKRRASAICRIITKQMLVIY